MSTGIVYNYHYSTGEYQGQAEAPMDPVATQINREFTIMVPANATDIAPPEAVEGMVRVFVDGAWQQMEDHRGTVLYSTADKSVLTIDDFGELPAGYTEIAPGEFDSWDEQSGQWVTDTELQTATLFAKKVSDVTKAVQQRLDDFAKTRNYDGILSAASYSASTVTKFADEGQYAVEARDATWSACYQILDDVQNELRTEPTVEELLSELPTLEWPV